jgi:REP element-mobilizing transposase RayT
MLHLRAGMQQIPFFHARLQRRTEHGGAFSVKKRRSRRPLDTRKPLHVTLRSAAYAKGPRSLLKHQPLIGAVLRKGSRLFSVRVYQSAICGNHIHLVIRGKTRVSVQNFFRVVAGHIAQGILREYPLPGGGAPHPKEACKKNQRKFWDLLIYSRIVGWGRELEIVKRYLTQNTLEALGLVAYRPRTKPRRLNSS